MWLIKKIGSLSFAVILFGFLIVILIVSTSLESVHGTDFAQKMFYQTRWFDIFLSLLWLNICCATVIRLPFKKHQTGFVITHIGILGLLFGALVTRLFGIEGQLVLYEGKNGNAIKGNGYQLAVTLPDKEKKVFDLRPGTQVLTLDKELKGTVKVVANAVEEVTVKSGGHGAIPNHAVQVTMQSKKMGLSETFWLTEKSPFGQPPDMAMVGPAKVLLKKRIDAVVPAVPPSLRILDKEGQELAAVDLTQPFAQKIALKGSGLNVTNLKFYRYARVGEGNKLVESPDAGMENPAVEFDIVDAKGRSQHYIKFALFPEFESMHAKSQEKLFDINIALSGMEEMDDLASDASSLIINFADDGRWTFKTTAEREVLREGQILAGQWTETGWMDIAFKVEQMFSDAVVSTEVVDSDKKDGVFAVEVSIDKNGENFLQWMTEGQAVGFHADGGDIRFELTARKTELPFSLALKDFRKVDYPGTRNAASFESDVVLHDPKSGLKLSRTIAMNKPLDYRGFRVFQSSYIQDPSQGEGSVFTVAKNPGIPYIYISSFTIFGGAFMQFYLPGFRRRKNNEKGAGA